jgi:uncharacterized RDD family membrane protein YckC
MEVIENQRENNQELRYAGFWLRFAAYLIDSIVLSIGGFIIAIPAILSIIGSALSLNNINSFEDIFVDGNWLKIGTIVGAIILTSLLSLVMGWLYYALMESSKHGGTLGKLAVSIKVTNLDGERISFARASGRYFARIITNMTLYIGYIMAGFTEKKQALHDVIASCLVIRK